MFFLMHRKVERRPLSRDRFFNFFVFLFLCQGFALAFFLAVGFALRYPQYLWISGGQPGLICVFDFFSASTAASFNRLVSGGRFWRSVAELLLTYRF